MKNVRVSAAALGVCAAVASIVTGCSSSGGSHTDDHVLLLSVDGMHQSDLAGYVSAHPDSAMAKLIGRGANFTKAMATVPSDSFPGLLAELTGGSPKTTGVYYDESYDRTLLPAGTTNCAGAKPGAKVVLTEDIDKDNSRLDAGQGIANLPDGITAMAADPSQVIDQSKLAVDPATCKPVSPADYVKVNSVFTVAHAAGKHTAWADKHPAYTIVNGKGGQSVDDLYTPEIASSSTDAKDGTKWTKDNDLTRKYDGYKVDAVVNEIAGKDHSGANQVGVPAIFGMNFQTLSVAQKLASSDGYNDDGTPGQTLSSALDYVDQQLGRIVGALDTAGLTDKTTIIFTAKHGQSPTKTSTLTQIDDRPILDTIDKDWAATHPDTPKLIAQEADNSAMVLWLADHSAEAATFVKNELAKAAGNGNGNDGGPKPYTAAGTAKIYAGADAAQYFGVDATDSRVPDVFATVQPGVIYAHGPAIAEHGGASDDDRHVPLVVAGSGITKHDQTDAVSTTEIAPTILARLALDPNKLDAVTTEHTTPLPSL